MRGNPNDPSCNVFTPPQGMGCEGIKQLAGGVTADGIAYYNPRRSGTDDCTYKCTCEHEGVHVLQGPAPRGSTTLDRAEREWPAYSKEHSCLESVLEELDCDRSGD